MPGVVFAKGCELPPNCLWGEGGSGSGGGGGLLWKMRGEKRQINAEALVKTTQQSTLELFPEKKVKSSVSKSRFMTWLACYRMGNGPRTKNGRRNGQRPFFGGGFQNGPWPDRENLEICCLSGRVSAMLGPSPAPRGCRP